MLSEKWERAHSLTINLRLEFRFLPYARFVGIEFDVLPPRYIHKSILQPFLRCWEEAPVTRHRKLLVGRELTTPI